MELTDRTEARTCFIAAPIETDLTSVLRSLTAKGIQYRRADWFDFGVTPSSLKSAIRDCDFMCIFSPVTPPPNLWFELGIAIGLGKPIFIVASQDFLVTSTLRFVSFVSADQWKEEIVEPHLEAFLKTLPSRRFAESRKKRPLKRLDFKRERREIENLDQQTLLGSESFIADLFRKAGMSVTDAPLRDFGADMAVWSPAIKRRFGDPILVEVKRASAPADHQWGINRLSELVKAGRGSAGVYIASTSINIWPA